MNYEQIKQTAFSDELEKIASGEDESSLESVEEQRAKSKMKSKSKAQVWDKALKKVAFAPPDPNSPKKTIGEQFNTIAKHPADFLLSSLKGEATGLAAGAVGGAIVAAPLAMAWAKKPKSLKVMKEIIHSMKGAGPKPGIYNKVKHSVKNYMKGVDASGPRYSQRLTHHLFELGKGETIGGGVIGLGLGMGNFFKKHDHTGTVNG